MKFIPILLALILTGCAAEPTPSTSGTTTPPPQTTEQPEVLEESTEDLVEELTEEEPLENDPVEEESTENGAFYINFDSQTMDNTPITHEIFADYDVTIINVWATWCPPCVDEMPYLQTLSESLPENAYFLTICHDAESEMELATAILTETGATFSTIIPDETLNSEFFPLIPAFPSTLYVGSDGEIIGIMTGVPQGDLVEQYLLSLDTVLDYLETRHEE